MIIWGYRTRTSKVKKAEVLKKSCPSCGGDLELHDLKKWFTLYFIPIFPFQTLESFYKCADCSNSYKEEIKDSLKKSGKQAKQLKEKQEKAFLITLAACMAQMAKADGKISKEEKEEIKGLTKGKFAKYKKDVNDIVNKVSKSKNDAMVFALISNARKFLTTEGIMMLVGQSARIVLSDGKVTKKEESLLKEYLLACGIPKGNYKDLIKKVKEVMEKEKAKK